MLGYIIILLLFSLTQACGDIDTLNHTEEAKDDNLELISVSLILAHTLANPNATFDINCDNVYNKNINGDWQQSNITASSSISIISNKNCQLTLKQYFDGNNTFTPTISNSPLIINIASNGVVTTTATISYTDNATPTANRAWFIAGQGGSTYSIIINYANDAISATQSISPSNLTIATMNITMANIIAPSVSSIIVTQTQITSYQYTLTAVVTNATGCKYIDNTSNTYTPSNWISVNQAYNNGSAKTCPVLIAGSPLLQIGNWNSVWKNNKITLVIWANRQNGINAYTTANFGP